VAEWVPLSVPPILSEDRFRRSQALHVVNSPFSPRHLKSGHYLLRGMVRCRVCDLGSLQKKLTELDREEHRLIDAYQAELIELDQLERRQRLLRQRREHLRATLEATHGEHTVALQRAELELSVERFTRSICGPLATLGFEDRQRLVRTVIDRVMVEEGHIDIHFAIPVPEPPTGGGLNQGRRVSTDLRLRSDGLDHGCQLPCRAHQEADRDPAEPGLQLTAAVNP
jgi:hypothetical protein